MSRRGAAALALACACSGAEPAPLARLVAAGPTGKDVSTRAEAELRFSAPIDASDAQGGARIVLAEARELTAALAAAEREDGAGGAGLAAHAVLGDGGRALTLRPEAPLRAHLGHVVVVSSRLRAADGRPVLDPSGRRRAYVVSFETGAGDGPPPVPALTEVRADADAPEAGGEYVEVANLGAGLLDLRGWRLGKRSGSGALSWCEVDGAPGDAVAPGGVAIVAGGAWDGRYALPAGVPVLRCGASALAGGLANDRAPDLVLADPLGAVATSLGERGAPRCPIAVERVEPGAADEPGSFVCTEGTPGRL